MNEHIDILMTTAKMATRKNEAASLTTHSMSAFYNISQMARYRYFYYQCLSDGSQNALAISRQYSQEMWKHTVLGMLDCLGLIFSSIGKLQNR